MPSSFTRVLSSALGFSPCPPVSVWGTVIHDLKLRGFSWKSWINHFAANCARHNASTYRTPDFPEIRVYTLDPGFPSPGWPTILRHPIAIIYGTGILTCFPSATLLQPHLRDRLTLRGLAWRRKPWAFGERVFSPALSLLMSAFSLSIPPPLLSVRLLRLTKCSPTMLI